MVLRLEQILLILLTLSRLGTGHPLSYYRGNPTLDSLIQGEKYARERREALTSLLIHKNRRTLDLSDPSFEQPRELDNGKKLRTSSIVKSLIQAAESLYFMEQHGPLKPYNPADTTEDVITNEKERWKNYLNQKLTKRFPFVVTDFVTLVLENKNAKTQPTEKMLELQKRRISILLPYLKAPYPRIQEVLGNLVGVDYIDGHAMKLRFEAKRKNDKGEEVILPVQLSLSMLITFRTKRDNYYLATLEALLAYCQENPGNNTNFVVPHLKDALEGATIAHAQLTRLLPWELDYLIDLFLQLAGSDIPLPVELASPENLKEWKPKEYPSIRAYIYSQSKLENTEKIPPHLQEMYRDLDYYALMDQQLNQLEDFLRAYKDQSQENEKSLKLIKENP